MGLDLSNNSKWMAASCYDKTIKLWDLDPAKKDKIDEQNDQPMEA